MEVQTNEPTLTSANAGESKQVAATSQAFQRSLIGDQRRLLAFNLTYIYQDYFIGI